MNSLIRVIVCCLIVLGLVSCASSSVQNNNVKPEVCTEEWFHYVEQRVITSDQQGHGPDSGSLEWRSVVEFKLGVRGKAYVPNPESRAWCEFIDAELEKGS